jgi:P-type Ca2+ transporter type 2C
MDKTDSSKGLSAAEAARRVAEDGPNALPGARRRTWLHIIWDAAHEPMFLLLFAAGLLYLILGEAREGVFLFAMVLLMVGLTLYQEGKTERALEALRDISNPRALVLRDGERRQIDSREVVRGDLLLLAEGDRIAADGLLVSGSDLQVDESLLTGESVPVRKIAIADANRDGDGDEWNQSGSQPGSQNARPGGDDLPNVYSGTLTVQGHGIVQVTQTGARSEIGRIGSALQALTTESSPLQKQTARMVTMFALLGLGLSLLLVLVYGWLHGDWLQALLAGIALAMSMLPEEFPVVLTVFPALGAWRLARQQVLTRRIAAIETLGATSVLCVDKTGTLTENRMTVACLYAGGAPLTVDYEQTALPESVHALVEFAILGSAVAPFDPMEKAFHRLGQHFLRDTEHLHRDWNLVQEYPLTPQLRAMAQVWKAIDQDDYVVAAKGAPEAIIDLCHLDAARQQPISDAAQAMAGQGLRVLGVAQASFSGMQWPDSEHDFDFVFLGLIGLADPLRADIPEAMRQCHQAGIRVIMITGDYPLTASTIAHQAGIAAGETLTGDELAGLDDAELGQRIAGVSVCARIAPEQKLRIVQALKAGGAIVAMTGDGVNDAPALKAAHVGIAMGQRGTDVAREAASLVLLDDRFSSIVHAVRLGRRIFSNMQKAMSYVLAMHVPIAGMALLPVLLGWPILLYPMHIVFLELIIDPACSLAFENEPSEPDSMQTAPRNPKAALFGGWTLAIAALEGLGALVATLAAYGWALHALPEPQARAFGFSSLIIANLALIFANRSRSRTIIESLRAPNPILWAVTGATLALLALALYLPYLMDVFRFGHLAPAQLASACAIGMASVLWFEILKLARRRAQ